MNYVACTESNRLYIMNCQFNKVWEDLTVQLSLCVDICWSCLVCKQLFVINHLLWVYVEIRGGIGIHLHRRRAVTSKFQCDLGLNPLNYA